MSLKYIERFLQIKQLQIVTKQSTEIIVTVLLFLVLLLYLLYLQQYLISILKINKTTICLLNN